MIEIGDKIISKEIIEKKFICDLEEEQEVIKLK